MAARSLMAPRFLVASIVALTAALGIGAGMKLAAGSDGGTLAERNLARAREIAPFDVRTPSDLPPGARLERVAFTPPTGDAFSVDIVYVMPGGSRIHLWQTNLSGVALRRDGKDPASSGATIELDGEKWQRHTSGGSAELVQLARRFPDAVTLTIDGLTTREDELRTIAASLRAEDG